MSGADDGKGRRAAGNRRGKAVAGLIMMALFACLSACAQTVPAPAGSAEQPPGSFNVQIGGRMTYAIGAAAAQ